MPRRKEMTFDSGVLVMVAGHSPSTNAQWHHDHAPAIMATTNEP